MPANIWLLAPASIAIEVLPPIAATDATREVTSTLTEQASDAIRVALAMRT